MNKNADSNSQQMWHITTVQSTISFFCGLVLTLFFKNKIPMISLSFMVMAIVSGINLAILFFLQDKKSLRIASAIYILNVFVDGCGVLVNHYQWIQMGVPFEAFFGFKIISLIVAMQAPTVLWVGWSSLSFLLVAPLIQFFLWNPEQQKLLGVQEPGFTVVVILSCGLIYYQRLKIFAMIQKQAQLQASAQQIRRFAHLLLGTQHLINSPLQVIETAVELIRLKHPETESLVQKIETAFEPIRSVSRLLSFGRKHLDWDKVNIALTVEDLEKEIQKISSSDLS